MCAVQSCHVPFFCSCLFPMIVHLRCWAHLLPEQMGRQTNRCEIVINISNLTVGVKHSIGPRTTFFPNLHSVDEERLECLPILQHQYHDFPTSYLKQTALDSWDNIYFGLPYLSQESMVLSQLQLAYLYYLELSLTVLQNYRIVAFANLWLTSLKYQKVEKQQQ